MKTSKALVILSPGFASSEADSTCLPMQQAFVRCLQSVFPELNVIIVSFHYPFEKRVYPWFGATVISLGGKNKKGLWTLWLRREAMQALQRIHREYSIIGLLSFWYGECALVGKSFGDLHGIRHRCWLLGQDARKNNRYPVRKPLKAEELIALSDFLKEEFQRNHGVRPASLVYPVVDTTGLQPGVVRDIDLLAVGSLIPLKQFEMFIRLVASVKEKFSTVKAVLIGQGPERNRLQDLVRDMDLKDTISLKGEIPHSEVLQMMQRSKVLVHPSSYEGFSGVCHEALSAGMHVVSFCRAMHYEIPQWHIGSEKEMETLILGLLQNKGIKYEPVAVNKSEESVRAMMRLFEYGPAYI